MWTDDQLDQAQYVANHEYESKQPLNVGTIEVAGVNGGVYLMTPVPPYGSLTGMEGSIAGKNMGTHVPMKQWSPAYTPKGLPVPDRPTLDRYVIHHYGDGSL